MGRSVTVTILGLLSACGGGAEPAPAETPPTPAATSQPAPAAAPAAGGGGSSGAAAPDATGGADAPHPPVPVEARPFLGPCAVRWSDGRRLAFKYGDDGGSISLDRDGDGKRDDCATFTSRDGALSYLRIDTGCDRTTDATVRVSASGDAGLVSARVIEGERARTASILRIPGGAGMLPGYLLEGRPAGLEVKRRGGKIRTITARAGEQRRRLHLSWDEAGRLQSLEEDLGADGSVDGTFTYQRDDHGNVTKITYRAGERTLTAVLTYDCW